MLHKIGGFLRSSCLPGSRLQGILGKSGPGRAGPPCYAALVIAIARSLLLVWFPPSEEEVCVPFFSESTFSLAFKVKHTCLGFPCISFVHFAEQDHTNRRRTYYCRLTQCTCRKRPEAANNVVHSRVYQPHSL
jgi:hypothetical protein